MFASNYLEIKKIGGGGGGGAPAGVLSHDFQVCKKGDACTTNAKANSRHRSPSQCRIHDGSTMFTAYLCV